MNYKFMASIACFLLIIVSIRNLIKIIKSKNIDNIKSIAVAGWSVVIINIFTIYYLIKK